MMFQKIWIFTKSPADIDFLARDQIVQEPTHNKTHPLERLFAILGTLICSVITISIWLSLGRQQPMWPLPAFYFVEMIALSIASALEFLLGKEPGKFITWAAVGMLIAFAILGAWSVGFFYLPVALIFAVISITSDVRNKQPIALHLGICLFAGIVQASLMLIAIRLL